MTPEHVRSLYAQPRELQIGQIVREAFSCVDDRVSSLSLYTPGGDLGEFLLALAVVAEADPEGGWDSEDRIVQEMRGFVQGSPSGRRFLHCTDDAAVAHVEHELGIVGLDLTAPPQSNQQEILANIGEAQNVGDTHFRAMLSNPTYYHLEKDMIVGVMKAFYRLLWDVSNPTARDRMHLEVLSGKRQPAAFLEVEEGAACLAATQAPLLKSRTKKADGSRVGVMINHMGAVAERRRELSAYFLPRMKGNSGMTEGTLLGRLERHGLQWLEMSGKQLAKGLPFYVMTYE